MRHFLSGLLAIAGCLSLTTPAAPQTASARPSASVPPALGSLTEAEAEVLARSVSARVEAIRGLKFKRPVPVQVVSALEARAHFEARLRKTWSPEKARLEQSAYQDLGLLPVGFDLATQILDTLQEQAAGYYDPETGAFSLLREMPRSAAPLLMAHELTHALDDQHVDIDKRLLALADDDEASSAFAAVVEGTGTLVMTVYMLQEMQAGRLTRAALAEFQVTEGARSQSLLRAPLALQRALLAPYLLGQSFLLRGQLERLREGVDPADIARAYANPPVSTEQVMHPQKYWGEAPDLPMKVRVPSLVPDLGPGWARASEGTLGELTVGLLVGARLPPLDSPGALLGSAWSNAAADGWSGDRYAHYVSGTRRLTVLATVWDSPSDAEAFAAALSTPGGTRAFRYGRGVVIVAGDAEDRREAIGTRVLQALAQY